MKIYLVGGAVRDQLLRQAVTDRDYVVVGANAEDLRALGYQSVGKDFPVFLHPDTHEEYALARTERKSGQGYQGFTFNTHTEVTLEDDLRRRDLTINAMAQTEDGEIIDPYGGQLDLRRRHLRHVSEAFTEDPLRVLRVARFAARFAKEDFSVAPETMQMMRSMCAQNMLAELSAERVWIEFEKALKWQHAAVFFRVLKECGGLTPWFREFQNDTLLEDYQNLLSTPLPPTDASLVNVALLADTQLSEDHICELLERLKAPKRYLQLTQHVRLWLINLAKQASNDTDKISIAALKTMKCCGLLQHPERFTQMRMVLIKCSVEQSLLDNFTAAIATARSVSTKDLQDLALKGKAFGAALEQRQLEKVRNVYANTKTSKTKPSSNR